MPENMSTQMEVDDDTTASTLSRTSCVEAVLRSPPFVIISFSVDTKKNAKRANLQKVADTNSYQQRALLWTKYEHSYSKVYKAADCGKSGEFYAHKSCKSLFCKGP